MHPHDLNHPPPADALLTRRQFFGRTATGIGGAALTSLLQPSLFGASAEGARGALAEAASKQG